MLSRRGFFASVGAMLAAASLRVGIGLSELAPPIEHLAEKIRNVFHTETFIFQRHGKTNELLGPHKRTFHLTGGDTNRKIDPYWYLQGDLEFEETGE
jgi:hypothetical protein